MYFCYGAGGGGCKIYSSKLPDFYSKVCVCAYLISVFGRSKQTGHSKQTGAIDLDNSCICSETRRTLKSSRLAVLFHKVYPLICANAANSNNLAETQSQIPDGCVHTGVKAELDEDIGR